ncbi:hypothetical protein [Flaviaesturariibacter aridisoli]|nr:hypothetical protein [Flaviaesturariibacter aridisoli]
MELRTPEAGLFFWTLLNVFIVAFLLFGGIWLAGHLIRRNRGR